MKTVMNAILTNIILTSVFHIIICVHFITKVFY